MTARDFPYEFEPLSKDEIESKSKVFGEGSLELNLIKTIPGRVFLPTLYQEDAKKIYNFELRPDDIWIVTYPKCGTTWMQETVWQIVNYELETDEDLFSRVPFLEAGHIVRSGPPPPTNKEEPIIPPVMPDFFLNPISYLEKKTTRRIIKTHVPLELLPPNLLDVCKVVYVCRNPKDCCVSYFHHCETGGPMYLLNGNFGDYAQLFKDGTLMFGDYWHHLKGAWKVRDNKNFKFIWYEDLKKDHAKGLRELCEFLDIKRTEAEIESLVKHLSLDEMRKRAMQKSKNSEEKMEFSKFFRKGIVGDWKNYFTGEKLQEWEDWIQENMKGTDIQMKFE